MKPGVAMIEPLTQVLLSSLVIVSDRQRIEALEWRRREAPAPGEGPVSQAVGYAIATARTQSADLEISDLATRPWAVTTCVCRNELGENSTLDLRMTIGWTYACRHLFSGRHGGDSSG